MHSHIPRFKKDAYKQNLATMDSFHQKSNDSPKKPMIMLNISVDSFSRRHFFRKCKKTVKLLNQMKQEGVHDVFDFKIHNVIGTDTAENLSRVFGEEFKGFHGKKHLPDDIFGEDAIWAKMRKRGFMTLLGFDACAHKLHRVMGSKPRADHVSETFFCANVKFSKYSSAKKGEQSQRCLGDKMAHWYLLNYTKAFTENY